MTAIAGFCHQGKVWIGGDSAGVSGWDIVLRSDAKVFRNGEFLFGFTTSFRMGQLLRYSFTPPVPEENQDVAKFMCTAFVDAVRNCLKAGGYAEKEKEAERGGKFLVGFRGRLFCIDSDYQVGESVDEYLSCGCGEQLVSGALFATKKLNLAPADRMYLALQAAAHHSAGVRRPIRDRFDLKPPNKEPNEMKKLALPILCLALLLSFGCAKSNTSTPPPPSAAQFYSYAEAAVAAGEAAVALIPNLTPADQQLAQTALSDLGGGITCFYFEAISSDSTVTKVQKTSACLSNLTIPSQASPQVVSILKAAFASIQAFAAAYNAQTPTQQSTTLAAVTPKTTGLVAQRASTLAHLAH